MHVEEWGQTQKFIIMYGNGDKGTEDLGVIQTGFSSHLETILVYYVASVRLNLFICK